MFYFYCRTTSGIELAKELNIQYCAWSKIRRRWRHYEGSQIHLTINWGCPPRLFNGSGVYVGPQDNVLNRDISLATSKWRAMNLLSAANVPVPPFSETWSDVAGGKYLARKDFLSGGRGIEVVEKGSQPVNEYDFCVRYIRKVHELRLHVFGNKIIHEQFKYVPRESNVLIRNHANGANFSAKPLEDHLHPDLASQCRAIALQAAAVLGLDFGAVDMIISKKLQPYVLEINTAPGLSRESGTYQAYLTAFQQRKYIDYA